jgi:peroxiredoxin
VIVREEIARKLSASFAVTAVLCILVVSVGPAAGFFKLESVWLMLWPLAFILIRFAAYFVLPFAACWLAYTSLRNSSFSKRTKLLAGCNVGLALILGLSVWAVEIRAKSRARVAYKQQFGDTTPGQILRRQIVGLQLPDIPLVSLDGQPTNLRDRVSKSRVAVLVFWMSADIPWSDNIKVAMRIHDAMAEKGVLVIGVNEHESHATVQSAISKYRVRFPVFRDSDGRFYRALGLLGSVEQCLIVDSTGKIVVHLPKAQHSDEELAKILSDQIAK